MGHVVRVVAGHGLVQLPDGEVYNHQVDVILTEAEFLSIPSSAFTDGLLIDIGSDGSAAHHQSHEDGGSDEVTLNASQVSDLISTIQANSDAPGAAAAVQTLVEEERVVRAAADALLESEIANDMATIIAITTKRWIQGSPLAVWTMTHNLGFVPNWRFKLSDGSEGHPQLEDPDNNTTIATFYVAGQLAPVSGEANAS